MMLKKVDDDNCLEGFSTLPTKQNPWDKSGSIPTVCGANVLEARRLEFQICIVNLIQAP